MSSQTFIAVLQGTMSAEAPVRQGAEAQLKQLECEPGATGILLGLTVDPAVAPPVQVAAAIYFKNRVAANWLSSDSKFRGRACAVPEAEKPALQNQLITTLVATSARPHLRVQLTQAIQLILEAGPWHDLLEVVMQLLGHSESRDHVTAGVLALYQLVRRHRWALVGSREPLEAAVTRAFPVLEALCASLMDAPDAASAELRYLVVKIFRYATYLEMPAYLRETANLERWFELQLTMVAQDTPAEFAALDDAQRASDPRSKGAKWCFANIHRFQSRYGGGTASGRADPAFAQLFAERFVPRILTAYWPLIERHVNGTLWLSEVALFHVISFFQQLVDAPSFAHVEPHLDAFLQMVVFRALCGSAAATEMLETDPEEYIRRHYDIGRDGHTADVAAGNFLYRLVTARPATCGGLLALVSKTCGARRAAPGDTAAAQAAEGALRVLGAILFALERGQVDAVLAAFVEPELAAPEEALAARACECVALFPHVYSDEALLGAVLEGVRLCFSRASVVVQLEAADALRALVTDARVAPRLAPEVPLLMERFLSLSRSLDCDLLAYVMETFVEVFAAQLEPFAVRLAANLCEQFMELAVEAEVVEEKEYQALGVLNTLISMAVSMNSAPAVTAALEATVAPLVAFVVGDARVTFLPEAMELLESCNYAAKTVSATGWDLFETVAASFDTFGGDYFGDYVPYLSSVVTFGFPSLPPLAAPFQRVVEVCTNVLTTTHEDNPDLMQAYEILQFCLVTRPGEGVTEELLAVAFLVFRKVRDEGTLDAMELSPVEFVKFGLAALYSSPTNTLSFLHRHGLAVEFFELWFSSPELDTVLGLKLQILATVNVATLPELPPALEAHLPQISARLMGSLAALPAAINRRRVILALDTAPGDDEPGAEELDAVKNSPIYDVNAVEVVSSGMARMRAENPSRYRVIVASLSPEYSTFVESLTGSQ